MITFVTQPNHSFINYFINHTVILSGKQFLYVKCKSLQRILMFILAYHCPDFRFFIIIFLPETRTL